MIRNNSIDFLNLFREFLNEKIYYLTIPNKEKRIQTFLDLYSEFNDCIMVEEYIVSKKAKYMKEIQLMFYEWMFNKYKIKLNTNLDQCNLDLTPIERRLYILKETHNYFKISELAEDNAVDYTTIDDDIKAIEKGISFMGTFIKPKVIYEGTRRRYEDTVHPFFLALNKTEAYALTKELPKMLNSLWDCVDIKEQEKINLILGLINRLQLQLSDKAKKDFEIKVNDKNKSLKFISEEEMMKDSEGKIMYDAKRGNIISHIKVNDKEYYGTIVFNDGKKIIRTTSGDIIELSDEDNIIYLDYE